MAILLTLGLAVALGGLAQRTGLCMVRAVEGLRGRRPGLLLTIIGCGVWFWLVSPFFAYFPLGDVMTRYAVSWPFVLGGLLFGLAAAANHGCSISTLAALARGEWHMLGTVFGWVLGWWSLVWLAPGIVYTRLGAPLSPSWWVILVLVLLSLVAIWRLSPAHRRIYSGIVVFGAVGGLLGAMEPHWSPSQLIRDLIERPFGMDMPWPTLVRVLISAMILAGMAVAAVERLPWSRYEHSAGRWVKHILAGVVMGIGAALALGGNDFQLLIGLPAGSPAAVVAVASIVAGIWLGLSIDQRLKERRRKGVETPPAE